MWTVDFLWLKSAKMHLDTSVLDTSNEQFMTVGHIRMVWLYVSSESRKIVNLFKSGISSELRKERQADRPYVEPLCASTSQAKFLAGILYRMVEVEAVDKKCDSIGHKLKKNPPDRGLEGANDHSGLLGMIIPYLTSQLSGRQLLS